MRGRGVEKGKSENIVAYEFMITLLPTTAVQHRLQF